MRTPSVVEHGQLFIRYRDRNDGAALEEILRLYHQPLYNYLMRMLRKREEAEDALQEVWLKVIRQKHTYREQGYFSSWLYRVAHNHCLDWYRRQSRRPDYEELVETEEGAFLLDGIASGDPSPYDLLAEQEIQDRLDRAIAQLPPMIREVYLLRTVNGIPFREIAEIQNCPIGTVLSRMHQAVKRLQETAAGWDAADNSVSCERKIQ